MSLQVKEYITRKYINKSHTHINYNMCDNFYRKTDFKSFKYNTNTTWSSPLQKRSRMLPSAVLNLKQFNFLRNGPNGRLVIDKGKRDPPILL